jgi:FKBP-type peptidyl-prolyl cis-trans isomerase
MKKMNRNEWVAVFASLGLLTYLFYSAPLISLFNNDNQSASNTNTNQMPTTGVQTNDVTVGSGNVAEPGDRITAHYVGVLTNGQVFDSSRDRNAPISFTLGVGQVIRGWDEGIKGMREGGKRVLTIAPDYGYGSEGAGAIPPDSTILFEVEVLEVEKPGSTQ